MSAHGWLWPLGLVLLTGCTSTTTNGSVPTDPRTANVQVTVLDASTNRWWYNEELYLKVESSLEPGVAILLPVTVGACRGQERVSHKTPFVLRPPGKGETLHLE